MGWYAWRLSSSKVYGAGLGIKLTTTGSATDCTTGPSHISGRFSFVNTFDAEPEIECVGSVLKIICMEAFKLVETEGK